MSIIADALKKAQKISQIPKKIDKARPKESSPMPIEKKSYSSKKPYLVAVLVLILALGVATFLYLNPKNFSSPSEIKITLPKTQVPAPAVKKALDNNDFSENNFQSNTPSNTDALRSLKLSGIMYTPKRPLAVINGNVWEEGEIVEEFTILEINENSIKVSADNQEFVIQLKR